MAEEPPLNTVEQLLDRLKAADESAAEELVAFTYGRLRRLAHIMLDNYPPVHQYEETDDVLQQAMIRFIRTLKTIKPSTERDFYNLAAVQMRRVLLDLWRHSYQIT